jgi:hypothetical protein
VSHQMDKPPRKSDGTSAKREKLVRVALVEDKEKAQEYATRLLFDGIPATIEELQDQHAVAVMVPQVFLEPAEVVIESLWADDDPFDSGPGDEEDGDFESHLFGQD